jgi:hypothetical protein
MAIFTVDEFTKSIESFDESQFSPKVTKIIEKYKISSYDLTDNLEEKIP